MTDTLDPDFRDRVLIVEILSYRLKTLGERGMNIAALSRATGAPYESTRRRVKQLIEKDRVVETPSGLDLANRDAVLESYDQAILLFLERARRLIGDPPH